MAPTLSRVAESQEWKHAELRELSEADRAYRAAFQELTSAGGFSPSSFASLLTAVGRLHDIVQRLEQRERPKEK